MVTLEWISGAAMGIVDLAAWGDPGSATQFRNPVFCDLLHECQSNPHGRQHAATTG